MRVFTSDGTEVFHYGGCDPHEHVRGEVVEVSFDGSSFLTVKLHTDNEGSHVRSEFCILEAGKSLNSGLCICYRIVTKHPSYGLPINSTKPLLTSILLSTTSSDDNRLKKKRDFFRVLDLQCEIWNL